MRWDGHWLCKAEDDMPSFYRVWQYLPTNLVADTGYINWPASESPESLSARLGAQGFTNITRFTSLEDMRSHYSAMREQGFTKFRPSMVQVNARFLLYDHLASIEHELMINSRPFSHLEDDNWDYNAIG